QDPGGIKAGTQWGLKSSQERVSRAGPAGTQNAAPQRWLWVRKRGRRLSTGDHRALRRYALADLGTGPPREPGMSWIEGLGALLTAGLFVYLLYALLRAERF